jgi:hypothetical protein
MPPPIFPRLTHALDEFSLYLGRHFFRSAAPQVNRSSAIRAVRAEWMDRFTRLQRRYETCDALDDWLF